MVEIPVLLATFARPEYAHQTFNAIKKAKPKKFYFYCNKARQDNPVEIERNNQVRALVNEIDWPCDLKTYFREEYVDLYTSLWGAYDWIFENEEQAIIFEEDCVPSLSFFDFCEQLLPKYKNDQRVWVISGNNFIEGYNPNGYDYFFTPMAYQYGWASWRDRWQKVNRHEFSVKDMFEYNLSRQLYASKIGAKINDSWLKKYANKDGIFAPIEWDYAFQMTMRCNGGFGIVPKYNLVSNIGVTGTHNKGFVRGIHNRQLRSDVSYPISKHPPFVVSDYKFTTRFLKKITRKKPFFIRAIKFIGRKLFNNKP